METLAFKGLICYNKIVSSGESVHCVHSPLMHKAMNKERRPYRWNLKHK